MSAFYFLNVGSINLRACSLFTTGFQVRYRNIFFVLCLIGFIIIFSPLLIENKQKSLNGSILASSIASSTYLEYATFGLMCSVIPMIADIWMDMTQSTNATPDVIERFILMAYVFFSNACILSFQQKSIMPLLYICFDNGFNLLSVSVLHSAIHQLCGENIPFILIFGGVVALFFFTCIDSFSAVVYFNPSWYRGFMWIYVILMILILIYWCSHLLSNWNLVKRGRRQYTFSPEEYTCTGYLFCIVAYVVAVNAINFVVGNQDWPNSGYVILSFTCLVKVLYMTAVAILPGCAARLCNSRASNDIVQLRDRMNRQFAQNSEINSTEYLACIDRADDWLDENSAYMYDSDVLKKVVHIIQYCLHGLGWTNNGLYKRLCAMMVDLNDCGDDDSECDIALNCSVSGPHNIRPVLKGSTIEVLQNGDEKEDSVHSNDSVSFLTIFDQGKHIMP